MRQILGIITIATIIALAMLIGSNKSFGQEPGKLNINLTNVVELKLGVSCNLMLTQGDKPMLSIVAKKGYMSEITTKVEGNQLIIKRENRDQDREDVTIYFTLPRIEKIKINNDVKLNTTNMLTLEALEINVNGVLSGNLAITTSSLNIESNGVLKLSAKGSADMLNLDMPGVGNADFLNLKVKKAQVEINGVGNATVDVEEYLDAVVNGVGKVDYKGNPQLKVKISGIGKVKEI